MPKAKKLIDNGDHINLKVRGQDGGRLYFRMKRTTQMRKLMNAYCDKLAINFYTVTFLFDHRVLKAGQTPNELEMEDGDEIDAMFLQIGGGFVV